MMRARLLKLAGPALLLVAIAAFSASSAQAGWWHWGLHHHRVYATAYYSPVYSPVYTTYHYRPAALLYRPLWGYRCFSPVVYAPTCWGHTTYYCGSCCYDPCVCGTVTYSYAPGYYGGTVVPQQPGMNGDTREPTEAQAPETGQGDKPSILRGDEGTGGNGGNANGGSNGSGNGNAAERPSLDDRLREFDSQVEPRSGGLAPPYRSVPDASNRLKPTGQGSAGQAVLAVRVPQDARVFINDRPTSTPGSLRQYVSRGLKPGYKYDYEVRAEVTRNGKTLTRTQQVSMEAGGNAVTSLDFSDASPQVARQKPVTRLRLHVPADADVTLAGTPTQSTGSVRQFTTVRLGADEVWDDYKVVVRVERNGQSLAEEKRVSLRGGEERTLHFDLDAPSLAQSQ